MSVVKSKRTESKLEVLLVANQIAEYTICICSNEESFPKRYRWCLTNKLVDLAMDINNMVQEANAIYVKTASDYQIRRDLQTKALASTYSLLSDIDLAHRIFGIDGRRNDRWVGQVTNAQILIRNWRKTDAERYKRLMG